MDKSETPQMPWNHESFPPSMAHLTPMVREKAIQIANALLQQGYEEGRAIRIAIVQAKRWAAGRGIALADCNERIPAGAAIAYGARRYPAASFDRRRCARWLSRDAASQ